MIFMKLSMQGVMGVINQSTKDSFLENLPVKDYLINQLIQSLKIKDIVYKQ